MSLSLFLLFVTVHTGEKMDEVSRKIILQRRSIDNLKKLNDMILQYFNQTETIEIIGNFSTMLKKDY